MEWIKCNDQRINLDFVASYEPVGEDKIMVYGIDTEGFLKQIYSLEFDSQQDRKQALKNLDRTTKPKKIQEEMTGGSVPLDLG